MADDEAQKISLNLALLMQEVRQSNENFKQYIAAQEKINKDHEDRLRLLEGDISSLRLDAATIRERLTIAQLIQAALTSLASAVVFVFKR